MLGFHCGIILYCGTEKQGHKMVVDIIKKVHFVARSKNGKEYPLFNFNKEKDCKFESIEHMDVPGELTTKLKQDFGVTYFKITVKN